MALRYSFGLRLASNPPPGGDRTLVQYSDFTLTGYFRMPSASTVSGVDSLNVTDSAGLTHRIVGAETRLFTSSFLPSGPGWGRVYEVVVPSRGSWTLSAATAPRATLSRYWGRLTQGTVDEGISALLYREVGAEKRLYISGGPGYNGDDAFKSCLAYAVLNDGDGSHVKKGNWRIHDSLRGVHASTKQCNTGILLAPQEFADDFLGGRRILMGNGGYQSVESLGPDSYGPSFFAITETELATVVADDYINALPLVGYDWHGDAEYGSPTRCRRNNDYDTLPPWGTIGAPPDGQNGGQFTPPWSPQGSIGYWQSTDDSPLGSVFVDTGTKWGVLLFPTMTCTKDYYYMSATRARGLFHAWMCYDPLDLADVATGVSARDLPQPAWWQEYIQYPEFTYNRSSPGQSFAVNPASAWDVGAGTHRKVRGVTIDYTASPKPLMYVSLCSCADDPMPDGLVAVYEIN